MKILILNSGSSSIKFQLMKMPEEEVICLGLVERIGNEGAQLSLKKGAEKLVFKKPIVDHNAGLEEIASLLLDKVNGVISNVKEIDIVGHRVVHGGDDFASTTLITDEVKENIRANFSLAPLHNPHNLLGIDIAEKVFVHSKQVAVFDTAFHQTMPVKARKFAIPNKFYTKHKIQVYGFHGTSHKYVTEKAIDYLGKTETKILSIHLGNGCSITAVKNGKSIDHSLGFAPSNGLIMGSRSGDVDHSLIFYLVNELGYDLEEVNNILIKESGMLGLTGDSDLRDIESKAIEGDIACKLALEMNAYRIKKYIGAFTAALNGIDAIVFTAGIGENSDLIRKMVCEDMEFLGIHMDEEKNNVKSSNIREIHTKESLVKVLVIPTNEELEIAKQSYQLIKG